MIATPLILGAARSPPRSVASGSTSEPRIEGRVDHDKISDGGRSGRRLNDGNERRVCHTIVFDAHELTKGVR